jgi:hypothetical protein
LLQIIDRGLQDLAGLGDDGLSLRFLNLASGIVAQRFEVQFELRPVCRSVRQVDYDRQASTVRAAVGLAWRISYCGSSLN